MFDLTQQPEASIRDLLSPATLPLAGRLAGKLMTLGYKLTGKARYDNFRMERVHGVPLIVMPSVLNPKLTRTGEFFASCLGPQVVQRDSEVLDMGTGSGICAVFAANYARHVMAVDINAAAVTCTRVNALLNDVDHKIDVRQGDLFEPVAAKRFDLILFNPPFLRGTPRDDRDRAWRSSDVPERFAAGLTDHLKPDGCALVLLSSFGDARMFLDEFHRHDLAISVFAERRFVNEKLAIFRLTPPNPQRTT
jgi:HemK-related putative methylase